MGKNGFLAIIVMVSIFAYAPKAFADAEKSPTELLKEYEKTFPTEIDAEEKCLFRTTQELKKLNLQYRKTEDAKERFEIKKEIAYILVQNKRNHKTLSEGGWISKMYVCEGWTFGAEPGNGRIRIHLTYTNDIGETNFSIPFK